MKQRHKFESIVAETLLIPLYYRAKESRRKEPDSERQGCGGAGGQSGIRLLPFRRGEVERGRLRRARVVFRPCRAPLHREARRCGGGECGLWSGHPFPAYRDGKAVFYDMDLPEVIALRRELIPEQPGNPYIAASLLDARLAGRPASPASRCAFHLRGRRRADVFL